jgi:hypothetical protein
VKVKTRPSKHWRRCTAKPSPSKHRRSRRRARATLRNNH